MSDLTTPVVQEPVVAPATEQIVSTEGQPTASQPTESTAPPAEVTPTQETTVPEVPDSWDAEEGKPATEAPPQPTFNFTNLGSALGWGEIKDENDFVEKARKQQAHLKELETAPLNGIPEDLREVIEIAKKTPEAWKEHLSQQIIDYNKVDPTQLYEDSFFRDAEHNQRYFTDGKYDPVKAEEAFNLIPYEVQLQFGRQIQTSYVNAQRDRQAQIRAAAEAKLQASEQSLVKATQNLGEILPFSDYGIKFEPRHSSEIYTGITNSSLIKKHMGKDMSYEALVRSGADMKAITRTITLAEKGERMIKYKSNSAKSEAKAEILNATQNVQLNTPGSAPQVEDPKAKVYTPEEKMRYHLEQLKKKDPFYSGK